MVRSLNCLVDKHSGPDRYFRYEGKYRRIDLYSREGMFSLKGWHNLVHTGVPQIKEPNRVVNDLHQRTHDDPSPMGDLNRIYPNAIELGRIGLSRLIWVMGVMGFLCLTALAGFIFHSSVTAGIPLGAVVMVCVGFGSIFAFSLLAAWWSFRIAIWGLRDAPVLFNRKTRQVHAIHVMPPNFFKFWKKIEDMDDNLSVGSDQGA